MLTAETRKNYARLSEAKWRRRLGLFKAEGTKCVLDTLDAFDAVGIYATAAWSQQYPDVGAEVCSRADLERISSLSTPPDVVAVYRLPVRGQDVPTEGLLLALDGIQDPGNLGTVMRLADWFGICTILCSEDTVDCFSPKVVQATMGAISRVKIIYGPLPEMLKQTGLPVVATFLDGENIYAASLPRQAVIVIGNEGHGISDAVARCADLRLSIPGYPPGVRTSESLNAAVACALTVAEFRRPLLTKIKS